MAEAEYYDHMTIPSRGRPIYFRDAKLNEGRRFSFSGNGAVTAPAEVFDGTGDVVFDADLKQNSVTLDHISDSAHTNEVSEGDPRLVSAGAVYDTLDQTLPEPLGPEDISEVVDEHPEEPTDMLDFDNENTNG
jgi:hypothetical protein